MPRTPEPGDATPWLPARRTLAALRTAAQGCRGCPLWRDATRTVFGEGPRRAELMLVGEAPGDAEDRVGRPFVGPAGGLLDRALTDAGIDRVLVYITNAVKHFGFAHARGMRLHKSPQAAHINACRPWLVAEVAAVRPQVIVALGAVAARAVCGRPVTIAAVRGRVIDAALGRVVVTTHPSALLRLREHDEREQAFALLVRDLRMAHDAISAGQH